MCRAAASGVMIALVSVLPSGSTTHLPCCLASDPTNRFCVRVMISTIRPRLSILALRAAADW
jgi:hypothetical protein